MKKAGIVGGMGPESTQEYYKRINRKFQELTGRTDRFPNFGLESVNIFEMLDFCGRRDYEGLTEFLLGAVKCVHAGGARFAALAANTPHIVFDELSQRSPIPLVSIVQAACDRALELDLGRVGLLGTVFTMEENFFKRPFQRAGIEVVVPDSVDCKLIGDRIVNELERGIVREETKAYVLQVIDGMVKREGIQGMILGCTELPMLVKPGDLDMVYLDTLQIHVEYIVRKMLED